MQIGKAPQSLAFSLMTVLMLVSVPGNHHKKSNPDQEQAGVAFETIKEKYSDSFDPLWYVILLLPQESYSKENLDRLFRFFSRKHPGKEGGLKVEVYTDARNLPREGVPNADLAHPPSQSSEPVGRGVPYDAVFYRERLNVFGGGRNESYTYSPDLSNPNARRTVALKGGGGFGPREILENWETTGTPIKLRVVAYNLKHIDPEGTYYTFECFYENSNEWYEIMTFQQPDRIAIPRQQVRVLNNQVAYVFMGRMYAVTVDGGRTWAVEDVEDDLPVQKEGVYNLIQGVQINADGSGVMKLNPGYTQETDKTELQTLDFGKHWSAR